MLERHHSTMVSKRVIGPNSLITNITIESEDEETRMVVNRVSDVLNYGEICTDNLANNHSYKA
jgi:hypothetical protein